VVKASIINRCRTLAFTGIDEFKYMKIHFMLFGIISQSKKYRKICKSRFCSSLSPVSMRWLWRRSLHNVVSRDSVCLKPSATAPHY